MSKSHPVQAKYAQRAGIPEKIYLHAEIDAIRKCPDGAHTIYIARILKSGETGIAKPCKICQKAIEESTIKHIYYTDYNGLVVHEKL